VTYPDDAGGDRGYVEFFVDAALRLTKVTDQEGQDTTFAYDVMGRRLTTTRGTEVDAFTYTDWGAINTAQRGTPGNSDAISKVERYYDALNRLTRESQAIKESTPRNVEYAYDLAGNVTGLTYPSGVQVQTTVDALHRQNVIQRDGTPIADYDHVGPGLRLAGLTLETGTHDVVLAPGYDGLGRMTRLPWRRNGTDHVAFDYAFDTVNNLTSKVFDHLAGDPAENYLHDRLDRLTKVTYGQRTSDPFEGFTLDDLGNRTSHDDNGSSITALFNAVNELTKLGADTLGYSKTGNLTKDTGEYAYSYDRSDQLTRIEDSGSAAVASMAYDALGRRIERVGRRARS